MGLHGPFEFLKHKLWPKEVLGVKLVIWLPITKIRNRPDFLACRWRVTYSWKDLNEGYNFALNLITIRGLQKKLWESKFVEVPISRISRLQLGNPKTKWDLGAGPMARHREYYKGEGGGFPLVRAVMNIVNPWLPVACPCTKNVPTMHYPTCCLICVNRCE